MNTGVIMLHDERERRRRDIERTKKLIRLAERYSDEANVKTTDKSDLYEVMLTGSQMQRAFGVGSQNWHLLAAFAVGVLTVAGPMAYVWWVTK